MESEWSAHWRSHNPQWRNNRLGMQPNPTVRRPNCPRWNDRNYDGRQEDRGLAIEWLPTLRHQGTVPNVFRCRNHEPCRRSSLRIQRSQNGLPRWRSESSWIAAVQPYAIRQSRNLRTRMPCLGSGFFQVSAWSERFTFGRHLNAWPFFPFILSLTLFPFYYYVTYPA